MRDRAEIFDVTIEHVYDVGVRGAFVEVPELLARIPVSRRLSDPRSLALRALKGIGEGDVPGATAMLRRAIDHADKRTAQYLTDLYVPMLLSRADFDAAAEALVRDADVLPELQPAFAAMQCMIAARTGNDERSRLLAHDAIEAARAADNQVQIARILQRAAFAAYYREDFEEAQERALESARLLEQQGNHLGAARSYTILYAIASEWVGAPEVARFYAQRVTMQARLAGDISHEAYGLVAQLEIAAESGDSKRAASLRGRLLATPLHEQYHEKFSYMIAECLWNGWNAEFDRVRTSLVALRSSTTRTLSERSLCNALLAVSALGVWQSDEAKRFARLAISETAHCGDNEPGHDSRRRRIARVIASAVCVALGDPSRARRALSRQFDPEQRLIDSMSSAGLLEDAVPAMMRGYARLVNVACESAKRRRPQLGLTHTELIVLRALPNGLSLTKLAETFGKSPKTLEAQVSSIYAKLNVSNRFQAIERAKELGIYG